MPTHGSILHSRNGWGTKTVRSPDKPVHGSHDLAGYFVDIVQVKSAGWWRPWPGKTAYSRWVSLKAASLAEEQNLPNFGDYSDDGDQLSHCSSSRDEWERPGELDFSQRQQIKWHLQVGDDSRLAEQERPFTVLSYRSGAYAEGQLRVVNRLLANYQIVTF